MVADCYHTMWCIAVLFRGVDFINHVTISQQLVACTTQILDVALTGYRIWVYNSNLAPTLKDQVLIMIGHPNLMSLKQITIQVLSHAKRY